MDKRYKSCPKCGDTDVEILDDQWTCWNCDWTDELTEEERDERTSSSE